MATTAACARCGTAIQPTDRFCARCGADVSGSQQVVATELVTTPVPPVSQTAMQQAALMDGLRHATLGEYEIMAELGRGGMATVYLAHDIALGRKVAIKVMSPALQFGDGMAERFKREARTAASLSHPNIIPIYAVKESEQFTYFVMKFIEGRALDSIIKEMGPLPVPMVQVLSNQVCSALGHAHKRGIVHRDVKPANIMVDSEGWAVVTDFGIAKVAETHGLTMTGATVGTPSYMSPEQCSAGELTGASDQYSMGCVIYEMLAGKLLFSGDSAMAVMYAHLHQPPPPLTDVRKDIPPELSAAVMRMLEKDPAKRFPNMEAAVAALGGGAPLAPDDPIRTKLVTLAAQGTGSQLLKRMSTPASPSPGMRQAGRSQPGKTTTTLSGLLLEPARVTIAVGAAVQFKATAKGLGGSKQAARNVTWASTDTSVVTVTETGLATAVGEGSATVTAASEKTSAMATVEVTSAKASKGKMGLVLTGVALVAVLGGVGLWLKSSSAPAPTPAAVAPAPTNPQPAVTQPAPVASAESAAPAPAAPAPSRPEPAATKAVTSRIEVTPGRARVDVDSRVTLRAVTRDGAGKVIQRSVTWESSDASIADVSSGGVVTGVASGTTTITATSDRVRSAPITVTVVARPAAKPTGTGVLQVVIVPVWAYVSIDGNPLGQLTRLADTVSAGVPHHLFIQREGFGSVDTSLTIQPNEQRLVRIQMKQR